MAVARRFEKFQSPGKGNGLRATAALRPGELLYTADPFAHTVCKSGGRQVCDSCLRLPDRLLKCSGCKVVKYCGPRCQREAWPEHRRECKCLRSIQPREPAKTVQLLGRVIFKLLKHVPCPSEELYAISELRSNLPDLSEEMREGLGQLAVMLQIYLRAEIADVSQLPVGLDVLEFFAKVTCNTFSICNAEMQDVGAGLYPSVSLLNHDCDPNCVTVFEGKRLLLRAAREVQAGEELTIGYVNTMMPSRERQSLLKRQYSFDCSCYRCRTQDNDELMAAGDKQALEETLSAIPKVKELQTEGMWELSLAVCRVILKSNVGRLPDTNIYQVEMLECAMDACIYLGLFKEACQYGIRTLEAYRLYCPRLGPVKAIHLMKVGKLQYLHDELRSALETMKGAFDIMKITHGRDHRLTLELMDIFKDCQASSIVAVLGLLIN